MMWIMILVVFTNARPEPTIQMVPSAPYTRLENCEAVARELEKLTRMPGERVTRAICVEVPKL